MINYLTIVFLMVKIYFGVALVNNKRTKIIKKYIGWCNLVPRVSLLPAKSWRDPGNEVEDGVSWGILRWYPHL